MKKKVIIVHGWGGNPSVDWYGWVRKALEDRGFEVELPEMPNTAKPNIDEWVSKLNSVVGNFDGELYFIGHSIGCQAIMRYLEKGKVRARRVVLVAPWLNLTEETWDETYTREVANPWMKTPIDFEKVRESSEKFILIYSETDPYVVADDLSILEKELGARVVNMGDKGHLSGEDGVIEFPEIVNIIGGMGDIK